MAKMEEKDFSDSKLNLKVWKQLTKYMKPYLWYFVLAIIFMVFVAFVETRFPLLNRTAIDEFMENKTTDGIQKYLVIYGLFVLGMSFGVYMFIRLTSTIQQKVSYEIRKAGFNKLQQLSYSYYDKTAVGWIMSRMTSDINSVSHLISWAMIDTVWGLVFMTFAIVAMFTLNVKLALITLAILPFLIVLTYFFQKRILNASRKAKKASSKITGAFAEGIHGAVTTKTLAREEKNLNEFEDLTEDLYKSNVRTAMLSGVFFPLVGLLGAIATALVFWQGGNEVIADEIGYGTLIAFFTYVGMFFWPIQQIARIIAEFQIAQASAERIMSMIDEEADISDTFEVINQYGDFLNPKKENWEEVNGDIEFKNVDFYYKETEPILTDFSLKVKKGEKIALVGETGAGKSTIVNLICRFYEPKAGTILIDGKDYKERSQLWLQSNLGYVLQSPHLFSGTIKDNIRYGKQDATDEEVEAAAKLVSADKFIDKLDKGFDTEVGESGAKLSTGEKQLISFARAIIGNPAIFILDEATSSIDTETETLIQNAIDTILTNRTSFIIAHRLSTVRNADKILVLEKGKIIESGNHTELMQQKGHYYELYVNQFKNEASDKLFGLEHKTESTI